MAVVEYMLHKDNHRRLVPDFISDRGHWYNPADHTYVGWVDDVRDYYVPDTIVTLTKEDFVNRVLAIHNATPMASVPAENLEEQPVPMTSEQAAEHAASWYDAFVAKNSGG